jgi:uncharacterized protein YneF (UPF0154 family)
MTQLLIGIGLVIFAIVGYFINHRDEYRNMKQN